MKKRVLTLLFLGLAAISPLALSAQGFAVGVRAGTLGLGVEAALPLGERVALRGGYGFMPVEPDATIDDIDFTLTLPENWFNVGADFYLGGGFRLGGGMLFKDQDPSLVGEISASGSVEIGDSIYTRSDVATLNGILDSKDQAPYALLGFGRHTAAGVGLFVDLGVAFTGEPEVQLSAEGDPQIVNSTEFQAELRKQEQQTEDDLGSYMKLWPILNIGLKIGLGG